MNTLLQSMRRMVASASLAGALVIGVAAPTALAIEPARLDEAARADLARIEDYLNGITTLDSKFVQVSEEGFAEGRLQLWRPGRMRIEYAPPVPVLIVASDLLVMYYDRELEQTTFIPLSETPATFLLRERIDLSKGLTVTDFQRDASAIRVSLVETDNPQTGQITVMFEDKPLRLVKWRIVDAQGAVVDTALINPQFGVTFENADELFSTVDPRHPAVRGSE